MKQYSPCRIIFDPYVTSWDGKSIEGSFITKRYLKQKDEVKWMVSRVELVEIASPYPPKFNFVRFSR